MTDTTDILSRSEAAFCQRRIEALISEQPEIDGVLVSTGDGFEIAASLVTNLSAAKLSAMTSTLLALTDAICNESRTGECRDLVIDASQGRILVMDVAHPPQKLTLTVLCRNKVTLGQVLWAVRRCRDELSRRLQPI